MSFSSRDDELSASWSANAEPWTAVVRRGGIPSRRAGTDDAILRACTALLRARAETRLLDVGCGEGWLARALAAEGATVLGIDGAPALIEHARAAGGGASYEVADYARLIADDAVARGPWEGIVCNFALLGEDVVPLLAALRRRLAPEGTLLIQTVHPWAVAAAAPPYADGWRRETWTHFAGEFATPMPWYFRTLESWVHALAESGLIVTAIDEPRDAGGAPLSLLVHCRATTPSG